MSLLELALLRRWTTRRDAEAFAEIVKCYSGMVYHTQFHAAGLPLEVELQVQTEQAQATRGI